MDVNTKSDNLTSPPTAFGQRLNSVIRAGALPLLLAITGLPNLFLIVGDNFPAWGDKALILSSWIACAALLYLAAHRHVRLVALISAVIAAIALVETAFVLQFGGAIDANALSLLAETNIAELSDLLPSILPALATALALAFAIGLLAWRHSPPRKKPLPAATKRIGAYIAICLVSILIIGHSTQAAGDIVIDGRQQFPGPVSGPALALRNAYPAGIPWVIGDFVRERRALQIAYSRIQTFEFGATTTPLPRTRRVFILVIGETARADRLQINGYRRKTTPKLSARLDEITSFRRMYSEHTFSRLAVPALITRNRTTPGTTMPAEASIVTAFKEAGFRTTWISLQAPVGFHESPISIHAYEADQILFLNPMDYRRQGRHDVAALPTLRSIIKQDERDLFVVLHTLGSHFRYTDRYPVDQAKFLPDRKRNGTLDLFDSANKIELSNAYDNTIIMLDRTIDGAIDILNEQSGAATWLFYSSDHGEALFEDCQQHSGHGVPSYYTRSVAAMFWASPVYQAENPSLVKNLRSNSQSRVSTNMGFETLAELGGLIVPGSRTNHSIAGETLADLPEAREAENYLVRTCQTTVQAPYPG